MTASVIKKDVTITFLEQTEQPLLRRPSTPPGKVAILRAEYPPLHFFYYIYDVIGRDYFWVDRYKMSDTALEDLIHNPRVYLYILYVDGVPSGMAELDARDSKTVKLCYFGLTQERIGRGYGRYFGVNIIETAWSLGPSRVLVETCTLDHPTALAFYQKLGFSVYDRRSGKVEIPERFIAE